MSKVALSPLGSMGTQEFLQNVWQQRAEFISGSCLDLIDLVDPNELAGLACEESIDARIVSGHQHEGKWTCRQGPFAEKDFAKLPETNWSLLVQSVDQWHDEVHDVLARFNFLPSWRLDDIMISYAAPGGSVGPHFDYYDVFLVQISGARRWQLGQQCDDNTTLLDNDEVKLLAEFDESSSYLAKPGDLLYVPSGLAHWGVAESEECVTLSVGFRAPSVKEIYVDAFDQMIIEMTDSRRYQDTVESIDADPAKINAAAMEYMAQQVGEIDANQWRVAIERAFGRLVTDVRLPMQPGASASQLASFPNRVDRLPLNVVSSTDARIAYSRDVLFVDGQEYAVPEAFSRDLLAGQFNTHLDPQQQQVLRELISRGIVELLD